MRSFGLLVLAIVLPSCMRGCNPCWSCNAREEPCSKPSDCATGTTCQGGYCVDNRYLEIADACRTGSRCAERGECSAVPRSSFLGLDQTLECAATTDQDCRQSTLCRERGLCARGSRQVGCAAIAPAACRASERCTTHEECDLDNGECTRHWASCPPLAPSGTPTWLSPVRLVWDYETLRTPWHPGDVEHATLACRVTGDSAPSTTIRVAGRCAPGPGLSHGDASTFLHADVTLHTGDAIAFAADKPAAGSSFAQLHYDGSSPIFGGSGGETIECVVVPPAVALERARRELAALDRELAAAAHDKPDLDSSHGDLSSPLEDARVHAERAALWLGWNGSDLALRVVRLDAAVTAWHARLDAAIRAVVASDKPVKGEHMTLTRNGLVCGAALRAQLARAPADPGEPSASGPPTDCALELAIDNAGPTPISLVPGSTSVGEIDALVWLRPASADQLAEVAPAFVIAARVGATASTSGVLELPAGQRGLVLVGGATSSALLRGRVDLRATFALRP